MSEQAIPELLKKLHEAKFEWDLARIAVDREWYDLDVPLCRILPILDAVDDLDTKEKALASIIQSLEEKLAKLKA